MTDRELLQQALDAIDPDFSDQVRIANAIRARLAQPEQEPFAWADLNSVTEQFNTVNCGTVYRLPCDEENRKPLYTAPQPAQKPLTDEDIYLATNHIDRNQRGWAVKFARAIEAAHGITATRTKT